MAAEDFIIRIVLEAQSQIAPVMAAAASEADRLKDKFQEVDRAAGGLDRKLVQLEGHVSKARDTFRSLNPTLDSFDRKMKSVNETTTAINRNFGVLERQSRKAGEAFGALGTIVTRLEKRLEELDQKMTEMGARKYEPKFDVETKKSEAKVDALLKKLASAARGTYTAKTDVEIGQAIAKTEALRKELESLGHGGIAVDLLVDIGDEHFKAQLAKMNADAEREAHEINRALDFQARVEERQFQQDLRKITQEALSATREKFSFRAFLETGEFNKDYEDVKRKLFEVAGISVESEVRLGTAGFEAERLRVEEELLRLGLKREHVQVILDYDRSRADQVTSELAERFAEMSENIKGHTEVTLRGIINGALNAAILFAEPLLSAITAVAGGLIAVGVAAGVAVAGIVGLAVAAVSQGIPALGLLALAANRFAAVLKVAQLAQAERDKGAQQGLGIDNARASALDGLRSAHEGVANAQRALVEAQKRLNEARRQGVRTLTDLNLAEQRALLTAKQSRLATALAAASGDTGGLIQGSQLSARTDTIAANRQTVDTARANRGGIDGLPQVVAATKAVADAQRALANAQRQVEAAARGVDQASQKVGAAASAYEIALGKLSAGERKLLSSIERFKKAFNDTGGSIRGITDIITLSFARAIDRFRVLLENPEVLGAFTKLAIALSRSVDEISKLFTTGPLRGALVFFANEASKNIGPLTKLFSSLLSIFFSIGRAASGPLASAIKSVSRFFGDLADKAASPKGQRAMRQFFEGALEPIRAFLKLGGAIINLFAALAGPGGATEEGTNAVDRLADRINDAAKYIEDNGKAVRQFFRDAVSGSREVFDVIVALGAFLVRTFDPKALAEFAQFIKQVVLPVLTGFIIGIGFLVRALLAVSNTPAGTFLLQLTGAFVALRFIVLRLVATFLGLGATLLRFARFLWVAGIFRAIGTAIFFVRSAFMALLLTMGPVGWIILIIGALTTLYLTWGKFRKVVNDVFEWIKDHWKLVVSIVLGPIGLIIAGIATFGDDILSGIKSAVRGVFGYLRDNWRKIIDIIGGPLDFIVTMIEKFGGKIFGPFADAFNAVKDFAADVWGQIKGIFGGGGSDGPQQGGLPTSAGLPTGSNNPFNIKPIAPQRRDLGGEVSDRNISRGSSKKKKDKPLSSSDYLSAYESKLTPDEAKEIKKLWEDVADATQARTAEISKAVRDMRVAIERTLARLRREGSEDFDQLWRNGRHSMGNLVTSVEAALRKITTAFARSMKSASNATYDAFKYISDQIRKSLSALGADPIKLVIEKPPAGETRATGGFAGMPRFAGAGFVGQQGERGRDTVQALVGRGEAILNYAHQRVVEPAMQYFYGYGLGDMFKRTRAEHAGGGTGYAQGGYTQGAQEPRGPGSGPIRNLANQLFKLGFSVTSGGEFRGTGTNHDAQAAIDLGNSVNNMSKLWAVLYPQRAKFAELFGPSNLRKPTLMNYGRGFSDPGLQADHEDHIHVAIKEGVARLAGVVKKIGKIKVGGDDGGLKTLASSAITKVRKAANALIDRSGTGGPEGRTARIRINDKTVTGRTSVFGPPGEPAGTTASLLSSAEPGIALNINPGTDTGWNNPTTDRWVRQRKKFEVAIGRFRAILPVIDKGPAGFTKRAIDVTGAGARKMGINPLNFPTDSIGTATPLARGGYAWGGWQAKGGTYFVNRPTLFGAGENGPEIAHFATGKKGQGPQPLKVLESGLGEISGDFAPVDALTDLIAKVFRSTKKLAAGGKKSFQKLISALDSLTTDSTSPFKTLEDAIASRAEKAATSLKRLTFSVSKSGVGKRSSIDIATTGRAELGALIDTREGLRGEADVADEALAQARAGLARAKSKKSKQALQAIVNRLVKKRNDISGELADNAQEIVGRQEQLQADTLAASNEFFDRMRSGIDRARRIAEALGTGGEIGRIDKTVELAAAQIGDLNKRLADANKTGNSALAQTITDQIKELETSIVELAAQRLQAGIDEVNQNAERKLGANDLKQRFGQLGITASQARSGNFNIANLGRTDFAGVGAALGERDTILKDQRSGLLAQLEQAGKDGNIKAQEELTKQIGELDASIVDNTKAIADNTQAAINDAISRRQTTSDFFLGANQQQIGILTALGLDPTGAQQQRGSFLQDRIQGDKGSLATIINSVVPGLVDTSVLGGMSGEGLLPFLTKLYQSVLDTGLYSDDQLEAIRNLITGLGTNTQALIENTNELGGGDGQSFSSTAWTMFRRAIFNGSGGLLPQFQIPSLDTGGVMTKDGLIYAHAGEAITPYHERMAGKGGGDTNVNVDIHESDTVVDPVHLANKIAYTIKTAR